MRHGFFRGEQAVIDFSKVRAVDIDSDALGKIVKVNPGKIDEIRILNEEGSRFIFEYSKYIDKELKYREFVMFGNIGFYLTLLGSAMFYFAVRLGIISWNFY